jgi:hypothetical protein
MANRHRGEISAVLNDQPYTLCLTLGALAELEDTLKADDILALMARIASGKLKAREAIAIIGAGLRASGHRITDANVAQLTAPQGLPGLIDIVARLLAATFGTSDGPPEVTSQPTPAGPPAPFPGAQ